MPVVIPHGATALEYQSFADVPGRSPALPSARAAPLPWDGSTPSRSNPFPIRPAPPCAHELRREERSLLLLRGPVFAVPIQHILRPSRWSGAGKGDDPQWNRDMLGSDRMNMVSSTVSFGIFHWTVVLKQEFILWIKHKWRTTQLLFHPLSASLPNSGVCTVIERSVRAAIYSLWDLHNHLLGHRQEKGRRTVSQKDPPAENFCWQLTRDPTKGESCLHHLPQSSYRSCLVSTHSRIPPASSSLTTGISPSFPFFLPGCSRVCNCTTSLRRSRTRAPEKEKVPDAFGISTVFTGCCQAVLSVANTGAHITQTKVEDWNQWVPWRRLQAMGRWLPSDLCSILEYRRSFP